MIRADSRNQLRFKLQQTVKVNTKQGTIGKLFIRLTLDRTRAAIKSHKTARMNCNFGAKCRFHWTENQEMTLTRALLKFICQNDNLLCLDTISAKNSAMPRGEINESLGFAPFWMSLSNNHACLINNTSRYGDLVAQPHTEVKVSLWKLTGKYLRIEPFYLISTD